MQEAQARPYSLSVRLLDLKKQGTEPSHNDVTTSIPYTLRIDVKSIDANGKRTILSSATYDDIAFNVSAGGHVELASDCCGRPIIPGGHLKHDARGHSAIISFVKRRKGFSKKTYMQEYVEVDLTMPKTEVANINQTNITLTMTSPHAINTSLGNGACDLRVASRSPTSDVYDSRRPLLGATCRLELKVVSDERTDYGPVDRIEDPTYAQSDPMEETKVEVISSTASMDVSSLPPVLVQPVASASGNQHTSFYHSATNLPILPGEEEYDSDDYIDMSFLTDILSIRLASLSADLPFLNAWNAHIIVDRPIGKCHYKASTMRFLKKIHGTPVFSHKRIMLLLFALGDTGFLEPEEIAVVATKSKNMALRA
ncbi:hypothetical protein DFJ77DRAFT_472377 [Powellomyces hirtus]|nr:hypothetical protein DFJ77DRAFT_472377 [Powellomyces hirtus]